MDKFNHKYFMAILFVKFQIWRYKFKWVGFCLKKCRFKEKS